MLSYSGSPEQKTTHSSKEESIQIKNFHWDSKVDDFLKDLNLFDKIYTDKNLLRYVPQIDQKELYEKSMKFLRELKTLIELLFEKGIFQGEYEQKNYEKFFSNFQHIFEIYCNDSDKYKNGIAFTFCFDALMVKKILQPQDAYTLLIENIQNIELVKIIINDLPYYEDKNFSLVVQNIKDIDKVAQGFAILTDASILYPIPLIINTPMPFRGRRKCYLAILENAPHALILAQSMSLLCKAKLDSRENFTRLSQDPSHADVFARKTIADFVLKKLEIGKANRTFLLKHKCDSNNLGIVALLLVKAKILDKSENSVDLNLDAFVRYSQQHEYHAINLAEIMILLHDAGLLEAEQKNLNRAKLFKNVMYIKNIELGINLLKDSGLLKAKEKTISLKSQAQKNYDLLMKIAKVFNQKLIDKYKVYQKTSKFDSTAEITQKAFDELAQSVIHNHNVQRASFLIAFARANKQNPLKNSGLSLVNLISELTGTQSPTHFKQLKNEKETSFSSAKAEEAHKAEEAQIVSSSSSLNNTDLKRKHGLKRKL